VTLVEEIFGPVVTVSGLFRLILSCELRGTQVFVYEDEDYEKTLDLIDNTTAYALTGAMYVPGPFVVGFNHLIHFFSASLANVKHF